MIFVIRPNLQNFHFTKCSPLNRQACFEQNQKMFTAKSSTLNEIAKFSSATFSHYMVYTVTACMNSVETVAMDLMAFTALPPHPIPIEGCFVSCRSWAYLNCHQVSCTFDLPVGYVAVHMHSGVSVQLHLIPGFQC